MHIAEGILPAEWAVAWAVPAAVGVGLGIQRLKKRTEEEPSYKVMAGLMGAAVFAISLMPIPVPVAGSVSHPAGTPLAAIVVGPLVGVLIAAISLLIQALFFAHGGLTTLGANIVSEGIVGCFVGFGVFLVARRSGRSLFVAGFLAGLIGDLSVYLMTATQLGLALFPAREAGWEILALFVAFLPTQLPLAILEGLLTGGVLRSLTEIRPDLADRLGLVRLPGGEQASAAAAGAAVGMGGAQGGGGTPARSIPRSSLRTRLHAWWRTAGSWERGLVMTGVLVAAGLAVWGLAFAVSISSGDWAGLDEGVMEAAAVEQGREAWTPFINTDVGDLLVLIFFAGAALAGLAIGRLEHGLRFGMSTPALNGHSSEQSGDGAGESGAAGRRWVRVTWGVLAALFVALALWAWLAPGAAVGPVSGETFRSIGHAILHPTDGQVLTARGGDTVLFAGMELGLVLGLVLGWSLNKRRYVVKARQPELRT